MLIVKLDATFRTAKFLIYSSSQFLLTCFTVAIIRIIIRLADIICIKLRNYTFNNKAISLFFALFTRWKRIRRNDKSLWSTSWSIMSGWLGSNFTRIHPVGFWINRKNVLLCLRAFVRKRWLFYTGYTSDLRNRLKQHESGQVKSTKQRRPLKLIYFEGCCSQQDATRREKYLKSGNGKIYLRNRLSNFLNPTG
jgi:putative endonuclease